MHDFCRKEYIRDIADKIRDARDTLEMIDSKLHNAGEVGSISRLREAQESLRSALRHVLLALHIDEYSSSKQED